MGPGSLEGDVETGCDDVDMACDDADVGCDDVDAGCDDMGCCDDVARIGC